MKTILLNESNQKIEVNLKRETNLKMKTILFSKEKKLFQMASIIGGKYTKKKIELHYSQT